jgi:(p)ppGpp synthase/HD superfamily hydrolase
VTELTPRFDDAVTEARRLHGGQRRKGTDIPYVAHLLSVSAIVLEDGGSEDEAIAGLLHDVIEDVPVDGTEQFIRERFGDRVADIVSACSDSTTFPKPPWRERKEGYLAHLESAPPEVLRVSLADKLHNARAILYDLRAVGDSVWARFTVASAADQLWYYRALSEVFRRRAPGPLADELQRVVDEIEALSGPSVAPPSRTRRARQLPFPGPRAG